jgi:uncharacterized protein involved in outer membrane biogenesis
MMRAPRLTPLRWTGIAVISLLVILLLVLAFIDWNVLKHPIERFASARSGRTITIGGSLEVRPWSWTPEVSVGALTVGNPPWEPQPPMAQVDHVTVQLKLLPLFKGDVILQRVVLERPRLYLHRDRDGRANWTFENTLPTNAPAAAPAKLPVVRDLLVRSGTLKVVDELRKLDFDGTLQANERVSHQDPKPFRVEGRGRLNDKPFTLHVAGGPLINLHPEEPYPFDLAIAAGDIRIASSGVVARPFDLAHLQFKVSVSGSDAADLYYLTQLAWPNSRPYQMQADIRRDDSLIQITDITGVFGASDLSGKLTVDASRKRPVVSGDLESKRLVLADLGAALGGTARSAGSLEPGSASVPQNVSGKPHATPHRASTSQTQGVFPDAQLQVERVRAMDADVRFDAHSVDAGALPLKHVSLHVKLADGILSVEPMTFDLPLGQLTATATVDARHALPQSRVDLRIKGIELEQFKGKSPTATPPMGGVVHARAHLEGSGDSVHAFVSHAQGSVIAVLPHGEIRAAFAELSGIDAARGLGLLLTGNQQRAEIRCGVAEFQVQAGVMQAHEVLIDTRDVLITGQGKVLLGPEELDLSIAGEPKKVRLVRLRIPIELKGHLRNPSIALDPAHTIKQGAIAVALGALFAPLAAAIAFVDPGLAKDANCAALLSGADKRAAEPARKVPTAPAH